MTFGFGDLKKGNAIELEGEPYFIVDYEKNKMQKRAPVTRIRLKSIKTGRVIDKNFSGYDIKLTPALVEKKKAKYYIMIQGYIILWTKMILNSMLCLQI